jgi:hypothetical protein
MKLIEEVADPNATERDAEVLRKRMVKQTRSFLGFMQYVSRFTLMYSALAEVLFDKIKDALSWVDECTVHWQQLKKCLQKATLMNHPDFDHPFYISTYSTIMSHEYHSSDISLHRRTKKHSVQCLEIIQLGLSESD